MKALDLDKKFNDNQKDILEHFDTSKIKMLNEKSKRINIDFPAEYDFTDSVKNPYVKKKNIRS